MRVGALCPPGGIESLIRTRGLSERQKEALALGIAVDLVVSRLALRNQGIHERPISNAHAAVIGGAFGHSEAVDRRRLVRITGIARITRIRHGFAELR